MIKLGITGGIGSGKSVVSKILQLMGIPVYIADIESKKLTESSPIIRKKLTETFGEDLYNNDVLNKKLLASYIFNDKEKLKIANSIIHPEVKKHYENWLVQHQTYPIIAQESAILFESGWNKIMDKTVVVYAPVNIRVKRVSMRDKMSEKNILERINNQMPDEKKIELSDYIINNDGTKSLIKQVIGILEAIKH